MIIAAVAAMGLANGVAYAEGYGPAPNTQSTAIPGFVAQAPTDHVPSQADAQPVLERLDPTRRHSPWLFPPIGKYLDQHAGG
jgi:hypothetical protein